MSSLPPDPYKILGVSKDAQLPEIRAAHRKLVLRCHPDKVQDPEQKEIKQKEFQQVQQAYELLSNDAERSRYDDKVKLEELRREKAATATSSPRTSRRTETRYTPDVRDAEPRPTTFASSPPSHGVYGHTPPSRSWDGGLYERRYDEKPRHAARKTASYEKTTTYEYEKEKPSRKEEERRRRKEEEEWTREKLKEKEKEMRERDLRDRERERDLLKEKEKEAVRKDKERRKEDKKKTDKDRRKESDEKHRRHRSPYVETYPSDMQEEVIYMTTSSTSKSDKKKSSSSRKYEEIPTAPPPAPRETSRPPLTTERERKNSETLDYAIRYLDRSGGKLPSLGRSKTYHPELGSGVRHITPIAVPTPPPAAAAMFAPPPMAAEPIDEDVRRSSGRPRRMSHDTPRSSKEKSHKKTGSSREPIIVDTPSPSARIIPSLQKSHSIPIPIPSDSLRNPPLNRANTDSYSRPPLAHGLERAQTWMDDSGRGRDRSRSRQAGLYMDESSEDDRDHRRRRGRRTQSPELIPVSSTKRYTVDSGKAIPVRDSYFEESPRSSKKNSYAMPNTSARRVDHRAAGYYEYDEEPQTYSGFTDVKYAPVFGSNEIKFSSVPHREELYAS